MALFNVKVTIAETGNPTARRFEGDDVHAAIAWGEKLGRVSEVSQVLAVTRTTLEIL